MAGNPVASVGDSPLVRGTRRSGLGQRGSCANLSRPAERPKLDEFGLAHRDAYLLGCLSDREPTEEPQLEDAPVPHRKLDEKTLYPPLCIV